MPIWLYEMIAKHVKNGIDQPIFIAALTSILLLLIWFMVKRKKSPKRSSPPRRLSIVEAVAIDEHTKCVLIKRDNVEHLVLINETINLLLETTQKAPTHSSQKRKHHLNGANKTTSRPPTARRPLPQYQDSPPRPNRQKRPQPLSKHDAFFHNLPNMAPMPDHARSTLYGQNNGFNHSHSEPSLYLEQINQAFDQLFEEAIHEFIPKEAQR